MILNTFLNYLTSRTVWVFIILFVINGVAGVRELIPTNLLPLIDGVLGILGIYFRANTRAKL